MVSVHWWNLFVWFNRFSHTWVTTSNSFFLPIFFFSPSCNFTCFSLSLLPLPYLISISGPGKSRRAQNPLDAEGLRGLRNPPPAPPRPRCHCPQRPRALARNSRRRRPPARASRGRRRGAAEPGRRGRARGRLVGRPPTERYGARRGARHRCVLRAGEGPRAPSPASLCSQSKVVAAVVEESNGAR
jgi:hypothetical protein